MKLVSLNVGLPRDALWHDELVTTGIFKEPVHSRLTLRTLNLDGDRQADLSVHGGMYKAVYCYPVEHYPWWKKELGRDDLPLAIFGENFTSQGLLESSVHIGDCFAVGSAEVTVTQPRLPCYKLGLRFGSDGMVKRFFSSGRSGFYLAVTREGEVGAGDSIELVSSEPDAVSVAEVNRLYAAHAFSASDAATVQRLLHVQAFPEAWKRDFGQRLQGGNS